MFLKFTIFILVLFILYDKLKNKTEILILIFRKQKLRKNKDYIFDKIKEFIKFMKGLDI